MRVKYTIIGNYDGKVTLENTTCTCVDEIISVIVDSLKSIESFKEGFIPKQQYKLIYISNKGYDVVVPQSFTKPEEAFVYSLKAFLNRSFSSTLIFTENSAWKFHFWVFKTSDKLLIMDANPKNPASSIRFTIKVSLEENQDEDPN